MGSIGSRGVAAAFVLAGGILVVAPVQAFELFGVRLWGEAEDEDQVEVIDPVPYSVDFRVQGDDEDLEDALLAASSLWSGREEPASGRAGLLSRARGDYRRLLAALYNQGYYGGAISIAAAGREVSDLALDAPLPARVPMTVEVAPGPRFTFGRTAIRNAPKFVEVGPDAVEDPASIGFATGAPALAPAVARASEQAVRQWRELSYAKARETGREVVADHRTNRLDATISIDPGRPARYGDVRVSSVRRVDPDFVAFMTNLDKGERFDPDDIEEAETRLGRLGVFRSIRIEEGAAIGPDGLLPFTVEVQPRRPRTIGFGASYSSIDGIGVEAYWAHRNLLGRAEQLRVEASVLGLGAADASEYTYSLGASFRKPGILTPDTDLVSAVLAQQQDFDTYRERSVSGRIGLSQLFGSRLTGELFLEVERSRIEDDLGTRDFLTLGPVARAEYDRRNDPLQPTSGYWLAAELQPFYEAEFGNVAARGTLEGRAYRGFGDDDRFVLAGRARIGSYGGAPILESPPGLLFFAGGGGSVRGYEYRSIGVEIEDAEGELVTVGGKSLVETSAELRARVTERFGVVGFVDGGLVGAGKSLDASEEWRVGAGLGVRYFTGIGALRLDVATPIDRRPQDSAVAVYIGIGQAF